MGILYPFCLLHSEFDKNANSACKRQGDLVVSSWFSDLEFAFFVRRLQVSALFVLSRNLPERRKMSQRSKKANKGNGQSKSN